MNHIIRECDFCKKELAPYWKEQALLWMKRARDLGWRDVGQPPHCETPDECGNKGYCPKDIACND